MTPSRLLVVAPSADRAKTIADLLPEDTTEVVWHKADDGGIFVSVLHDGLWDAVVFWGDPGAFAGGRGLDLVRATAPDLAVVIVTPEASSETAAQALAIGARALIPADDLPRIEAVIRDLVADRQRGRFLGDLSAVARHHSERYRGLLELSPEPLLVHRRGVFIYMNAAMARLLGAKTPEELIGRTLFDFLHPDDRAEAVQRAQRVWSVSQLPPAEWRVFRLDGSQCYLETAAWPIIYEDEPANLLVCRDITERKLAEEVRHRLLIQEQEARAAADAARERLGYLSEASSVMNAQLDPDATLANTAQVLVPRLADWVIVDEVLPGQWPAVTTLVFGHPIAAERIRESRQALPVDLEADQLIARVFRSGRSELIADLQDLDLGTGPDAARLAVPKEAGVRSMISVPLRARERILGVLTMGADRRRRPYTPDDQALIEEVAAKAALALDNARLFEALQEADRRKEEFLGLLGHELRNPLAAIRNAVALLDRRADQPEQVERWVGVINRQQALLSRLVDDLLDVSRINSGKIALSLQPLDLRTLVAEATEAARHGLDLGPEQVRLRLPDTAVMVQGDPVRLGQILTNLLDNAWKYNHPDGHVGVELFSEGDTAVLEVCDTGVGIADAALATIFEPFIQLTTGDRAKAGLGLGLTLVKRLTELHGGTVTAASPGAGRGSTFRICLPQLPTP